MEPAPCAAADDLRLGARPGAWGRAPAAAGPVWLALHVQRGSGAAASGKAGRQRRPTRREKIAAEAAERAAAEAAGDGAAADVEAGADASAAGCGETSDVVAVRALPSVEKIIRAAASQGGLLRKREVDSAQLFYLDLGSDDALPAAEAIRSDTDARAVLAGDGAGVVIVPGGGDLQPISEAVVAAMRGLGLRDRAQEVDEARLARKLAKASEAEAGEEDQEKAPVLFWKDTDKNGYLSNWARSPFVIKGQAFNCVEQYYMWSKAVLMGDGTREAQILATTDPQRQKRLGRNVHPWNDALWARHQSEVLYAATKAKFSQNEGLRHRLLATHPRPIAEASPSDRRCGIGIAPDDPRAQDPQNWRGENLLGRALERVRAELREELQQRQQQQQQHGAPSG